MSPVALAVPAVEPVSSAEMKAHLRLDSDDDTDLVTGLVVAARALVERTTRLALVAQEWRIGLDRWPNTRRVTLPLAPVLAVTAIRVSRAGDAPAVLAPALYRLDSSRDPVCLVVDDAAPDPDTRTGGIEIDAAYGFGTDPLAVPAPLRLAIRCLVARWYENRGDARESRAGALPEDVAALLAPYARRRLS